MKHFDIYKMLFLTIFFFSKCDIGSTQIKIKSYGSCAAIAYDSRFCIIADHQNNCLFTNKGHFSSPLWGIIGVLAQFYASCFTKSSH